MKLNMRITTVAQQRQISWQNNQLLLY